MVEWPRLHGLLKFEQWRAEFGTPAGVRASWEYALPDGCMYGCRSPGPEPAAINKPYMLVVNLSLPLMSLQCRAGCVRLSERVTAEGLPSCIGAASEAGSIAEISAAYEPPSDRAEELARDLERSGTRSSGGVSTNAQTLSEAALAERRAKRAPRVAAAPPLRSRCPRL